MFDYSKENAWYQLALPDYSAPAFVSGVKGYYGTLHEIRMMMNALKEDESIRGTYAALVRAFDEFTAGNETVCDPLLYGDLPLLRPAELLGVEELRRDDYCWTYTNVWGYPSDQRCRKVQTRHFWLRCDGLYLRCVTAGFEDLECRTPDDPVWRPFGPRSGGFPHMIEYDAPRHYSRLAVWEKTFQSLEELQADRTAFRVDPDVNFEGICEDLFGDG